MGLLQLYFYICKHNAIVVNDKHRCRIEGHSIFFKCHFLSKIQKDISCYYKRLKFDLDFSCVHYKQSYINDKRMLFRRLVKTSN